MKPRIVVLDTVPIDQGDLSWEKLESLGEVTRFERSAPGEVAERIAQADIVLTNKVKLRAPELSLEASPELRLIAEMATGFDNIDIEAARGRGITVSNVPSYSAAFTAQTTIALLLELCHQAGAHGALVRAGEWASCPDFSFWRHPLVELNGKTLVVVGLGNIGRRVARIAEQMGMEIIAAQVPGREYGSDSGHMPLQAALEHADVVSLHCPLKPPTRALVNDDFLGHLKPSALLINTGRGGLIDEAALARALEEGRLAGFAGDVLSTEPPPADNPLLSAPNALITPHIGWASPEARVRCWQTTIDNVRAFLDGEPQNVVS